MGTLKNNRFIPRVEWLEDRCAPAVYTVTDLGDAGAGTLRAVITQLNAMGDGAPSWARP